ncbi:MaoC family dehydratase [Natrialbaceae archaeon AArc-T1-2]|uniref:MaoC family dehydratase n=1 Tax=Natrialbaceae archaeon AArc-T1-2 TaxID=3053904 RepID=UPI00255A75B7|nr:MaoC family dehydratase [Natrialbaceae archaeon AArc-T1-2]WIV66190.1 MaoC family dehydratase [Natrialbaceae archaeon AArc-T1-2]
MTPLTHTLRVWSQASDHVVSSIVEANRATAAAFGVDGTQTRSREECSDAIDDETDPAIEPIEHERRPWRYDRTVDEPSAIDVGDVVTFAKPISDDDVLEFATASGDTNRLHLDETFAAESRFGERIVHGTLVSGLISAALARIPGVTIYLSQDLEFVGPVSIGDRLTATVEIVEDLGGDRYRLETTVETDDDVVVNGEAVVMIDRVPDLENEAVDTVDTDTT